MSQTQRDSTRWRDQRCHATPAASRLFRSDFADFRTAASVARGLAMRFCCSVGVQRCEGGWRVTAVGPQAFRLRGLLLDEDAMPEWERLS